jgi:hypothetical protein
MMATSSATSQGGCTMLVVALRPQRASMCARVHEEFTMQHIAYLPPHYSSKHSATKHPAVRPRHKTLHSPGLQLGERSPLEHTAIARHGTGVVTMGLRLSTKRVWETWQCRSRCASMRRLCDTKSVGFEQNIVSIQGGDNCGGYVGAGFSLHTARSANKAAPRRGSTTA